MNSQFSVWNQFRKGPGSYRDLAQEQDQDQDQIVDSHEISVEMKSSAEGEEEVNGSLTQRHQKHHRNLSKMAMIAVIVIFFFITGEVLWGSHYEY